MFNWTNYYHYYFSMSVYPLSYVPNARRYPCAKYLSTLRAPVFIYSFHACLIIIRHKKRRSILQLDCVLYFFLYFCWNRWTGCVDLARTWIFYYYVSIFISVIVARAILCNISSREIERLCSSKPLNIWFCLTLRWGNSACQMDCFRYATRHVVPSA